MLENSEFTNAYERVHSEHRTRVSVVTNSGERRVGESGGDQVEMPAQEKDAQIAEKFPGLTGDIPGARRADAILDRLWRLEELENVAEIPPVLILG